MKLNTSCYDFVAVKMSDYTSKYARSAQALSSQTFCALEVTKEAQKQDKTEKNTTYFLSPASANQKHTVSEHGDSFCSLDLSFMNLHNSL